MNDPSILRRCLNTIRNVHARAFQRSSTSPATQSLAYAISTLESALHALRVERTVKPSPKRAKARTTLKEGSSG